MFNTVSRWHHEVWASQFPFLHSLRDGLYGHINWSLAQAQKHSSMGLSQSFPFKWGGKTRPWTWFHFTVQKRPVPGSSGASLVRSLTWRVGMRFIEVGRSLLVAVFLPVLLILGGKGAMGVSLSSSSSSAVSQVGMLSKFFISGEALHLTGLCLIWFGVTIFSFGPSSLVL